MRDEAFDAAQRFGEREAPQSVEERTHRGHAAFEFQRQHRAEALLLAARERMPRVVRQAGVVHGAHRGMFVEHGRDDARILFMHADARVERAQPAQGEEAVERRAGDAQRIGPPGEVCVVFRRARDDRAADDVAVAVDVFRRRMHHEVGAEVDRLLQRGRQEGVVDHRARADVVRRFDREAQVGDAQQRVGWGFDPDQRRIARECGGERTRIRQIGEHEFEVALLRERVEQAPAAAIRVVRGHEDLARREARVQHQRDRRHAGGGHHAARAAFQRGERIGEQVARGIAAAGVVVAALLVEAGEAEVRREHQWRRHRAEGLVMIDARAHRRGGRVERARSHRAHAHSSAQASNASRRQAAMTTGSFRKASCP
jgi:hypothetical protein